MNANKLAYSAVAVFIYSGLQVAPALSATYDQAEYQGLLDQTTQKGYARVQVNLDVDVPLAESKRTSDIKAKLASRENALIAELGGNALRTGVWRNGLGQMGVYVTSAGLQQLAKSDNARSIGRDGTDGLRIGVYDGDGRLAKIEAEIEKNGFADVEAILNLENFGFDITAGGVTNFRSSAELQSEVAAILPSFLTSLPATGVLNLNQLKANAGKTDTLGAKHILRINREGLYALKEHGQVRAIQSISAGVEPPRLDPEVLDMAQKYGYADVIIDLKRPVGYSPLSGKLPAKAWKAQAASIRQAFVDILSPLEPGAVKLAQDFDGLASSSVRLSVAALDRLYKSPDPRVQEVRLNKGLAVPALAQSAPWINIPQAWNLGYTASGQYIAVFDTGFETTHPFLQDAVGQPKVIYEGCFGTQSPPAYTTLCPSPNADGDSPLGMVGSASSSNCAGISQCEHGTFVAGVAAGKRSWNGLSGIAPDARIIGLDVFSKFTDTSVNPSVSSLTALSSDISAGMKVLADNVATGEVTANLSLGTGSFSSTCTEFDSLFNESVARLMSLRIPVVAATGNSAYRGAINWPACAPGVIKVAASWDTYDTFWYSSNAITDTLNGPVLVAPGANIDSANLGGGVLYGQSGTSIAAPHVAGLYAVVKAAVPGISVADVTAWVQANAVPITVPGYTTLKRIRVPNL